LLQPPLAHAMLTEAYTQFCASFEHVARVVELEQTLPTALQTGSALHVQVPAPGAPVQLWCVPQAAGVPYAKHPLLPRVHVASPPATHDV
jgi:hypothetical protein